MASYKLNITSVKVLETVYLLNNKNYYPNYIGVLKIVNGVVDEDTSKFVSLETFSTLTSKKGRQLASMIHQLIRYGFLTYIHNKKDDEMYLRITFKGESNLEDFKKHHKVNYKKNSKRKDKPSIAYINN